MTERDFWGSLKTRILKYLEPGPGVPRDSLAWFREKGLLHLFASGAAIGGIVLIPISIIMYRSGHTEVLIADILGFFAVLACVSFRSIPAWVRTGCLIVISDSIGIVLFVSFGPAGAGGYWIFFTSLLIALILGTPGIIIAFCINLLVFSIFGILQAGNVLSWVYPLDRWLILSSTFVILSLFSGISLAQLLKSIYERFLASNKDLSDLREHWDAIIKNNEKLVLDAEKRSVMLSGLTQSEAKFKAIVDHSSDIVLIVNHEGSIQYASGACEKLVGLHPEALHERMIFDFIEDGEVSGFRERFGIFVHRGHAGIEFSISLKRNDGGLSTADCRATNLLHNPLIRGIIVIIRDVSDLRKAEARADFYENFDPLTKLPNRQKFLAKLDVAILSSKGRNRHFAVLMIGIDRFKAVNDIFGIRLGDSILRSVGELLGRSFRDDDFVGRERGDKFVVLLRELRTMDDLPAIIEKTQSIIRQLKHDAGDVRLSASIGVSIYPHDGDSSHELMRNSETALYNAKAMGGNTWQLFDAAMNETMISMLKVEHEIETGLSKDEFVPYYQPKVDRTGKILGMECLVRWKCSDGSIRSPAYFIEAAERSGSIVRIGNSMLRQACEQNRKWQVAGYPAVSVAVNISPVQLGQAGLVSCVTDALKHSGLDPEWLELEITESGIMVNERDAVAKLTELHELGITISIDDFGTGYSSFSKLKDFPVDTLKIDKSFIDPLPENERAEKITIAIIELAHNLGFKVVAEGIEKKEQYGFLDRHRCDQYQGYLFSKPLSSGDFETLFFSGKSLDGGIS